MCSCAYGASLVWQLLDDTDGIVDQLRGDCGTHIRHGNRASGALGLRLRRAPRLAHGMLATGDALREAVARALDHGCVISRATRRAVPAAPCRLR